MRLTTRELRSSVEDIVSTSICRIVLALFRVDMLVELTEHNSSQSHFLRARSEHAEP
jgi:hypothetical protein